MSVHLDVWPRVLNLTHPHYLYPKLLTHVCTYSALILVTPFSLFCFKLNNYNYWLTYINVFNVATAVSQHLWHKTFLFFVVVFLFTACDVDDMVINERLKRTKPPPQKSMFWLLIIALINNLTQLERRLKKHKELFPTQTQWLMRETWWSLYDTHHFQSITSQWNGHEVRQCHLLETWKGNDPKNKACVSKTIILLCCWSLNL